MAEEFIGMTVAITVVIASIVLAGILIGLGHALGYKRIEHFGIEELIQSVINAAIIGSFAAVTSLIAGASSSLVIEGCTNGAAIDQLTCTLGIVNQDMFNLFQGITRVAGIVAYYQGISLNFGSFEISPFTNLSGIASTLSGQLLAINVLMMLIGLNAQIALFIKQNMLALIFPIGLVLRTFFATRKVGGFLIALAIGLCLFYPAFVLVFPSPHQTINNSIAVVGQFNNNSVYAPVPVVDLNDNYAIAGKLDVLSGRCANASNTSVCQNLTLALPQNVSTDIGNDLALTVQSNSNALSGSLLYAVVAPIFSLIITIVFVKELGSILGSEIGIKTMAAI